MAATPNAEGWLQAGELGLVLLLSAVPTKSGPVHLSAGLPRSEVAGGFAGVCVGWAPAKCLECFLDGADVAWVAWSVGECELPRGAALG